MYNVHTSNAEDADAAAKLFIQKKNYTHSFTMKSVYIFNVRRGVRRRRRRALYRLRKYLATP